MKAQADSEGLRPLNRVSGRFATAFAAGSLAIKYGVLPWGRDQLLAAVLACQLDQLRRANGEDLDGDPSVATLRPKLVKYLADNHASFMNLDRKRPRFQRDKLDAVRGYRAKTEGRRWYYLTADRFGAIVGGGTIAHALKRKLANEGLLATTGNRFVVQRRIFKGGKKNQNYAWVHAFRTKIVNDLKCVPDEG